MKTYRFSILLLVLGTNIYAQDYHKTIGDTNVWQVVNYWGEGSCVESYSTKGEKIIDETSYKILGEASSNQSDEYGYIREDTIEKKILIKPNFDWTGVDEEFIYVDFLLKEGDSIFLYNVSALVIDTLGFYFVDSIRTIKTLIDNRKAFYLRSLEMVHINNYGYNYQYPIWVEGIGSFSNPLYPHTTPNPENFNENIENAYYYHNNEITCFFKDNIHVYQSEFSASVGCDWCKGWGAVENNRFENLISVYPNPTGDFFSIENKSTDDYNVKLINISGVELLSLNLLSSNKFSIDVSFLPSGMYYLQLYSENEVLGFKKIIKYTNEH